MTRVLRAAAGPAGHVAGLHLALLLGSLTGPALAASDTSNGSAPDQPAHEMGGNDGRPGFFDVDKGDQPNSRTAVPAPGKAAGTTSPNAPPPPTR